MPQRRFYQIIKDLAFEKKLVAAGAILLTISLFMPWYQDLDTFRTGDTFTGLTGPLYLAGLSFLIMGVSSLLLVTAQELSIRLPFAFLRSPKIFLYYGIFSFYLLFLVNSAYHHRNFGINITMKQSGFGVFMAFIAAALFTIGGYLNTRERRASMKSFEEEINEPLFPPVQQQKPKENLRTFVPDQGRVSHHTVAEAEVKKTDKASAQPYRMDL